MKVGKYPLNETVFFRSKFCEIFVKSEICFEIEKRYSKKKETFLKRKSVASVSPAKPKPPITYTSPGILKLTIGTYRIEINLLKPGI